MVTSLAANLPSRCCLFNNSAQFTTYYMQRFTNCTSENANKDSTSIFFAISYAGHLTGCGGADPHIR